MLRLHCVDDEMTVVSFEVVEQYGNFPTSRIDTVAEVAQIVRSTPEFT